MSFFNTCPGSKDIKEPFPETIKCLCGKDIEIWSDEVEVVCAYCHGKVTRCLAPSCLDWCKMAKECVGVEKYNTRRNQMTENWKTTKGHHVTSK
jgi:hypothetical protein